MNRFIRSAVRLAAEHPYAVAGGAAAVALGAWKADVATPVKVALGGAALALGAHAGLHYTGRMTAAEMLRWNPAQDRVDGWTDGFNGRPPPHARRGSADAQDDYQHGWGHGAKASYFGGAALRGNPSAALDAVAAAERRWKTSVQRGSSAAARAANRRALDAKISALSPEDHAEYSEAWAREYRAQQDRWNR